MSVYEVSRSSIRTTRGASSPSYHVVGRSAIRRRRCNAFVARIRWIKAGIRASFGASRSLSSTFWIAAGSSPCRASSVGMPNQDKGGACRDRPAQIGPGHMCNAGRPNGVAELINFPIVRSPIQTNGVRLPSQLANRRQYAIVVASSAGMVAPAGIWVCEGRITEAPQGSYRRFESARPMSGRESWRFVRPVPLARHSRIGSKHGSTLAIPGRRGGQYSPENPTRFRERRANHWLVLVPRASVLRLEAYRSLRRTTGREARARVGARREAVRRCSLTLQ